WRGHYRPAYSRRRYAGFGGHRRDQTRPRCCGSIPFRPFSAFSVEDRNISREGSEGSEGKRTLAQKLSLHSPPSRDSRKPTPDVLTVAFHGPVAAFLSSPQ